MPRYGVKPAPGRGKSSQKQRGGEQGAKARQRHKDPDPNGNSRPAEKAGQRSLARRIENTNTSSFPWRSQATASGGLRFRAVIVLTEFVRHQVILTPLKQRDNDQAS